MFIGSSSIRLWNLEEAFSDLPVVNRGFGGSCMTDARKYAPRIVIPIEPKLVVVYAGDNDIKAGVSGSTTMVNDPSPMAGGGPAWNTASAWGPGFLAGTFGGGGDGGACPNTVGDGTSTGLQKVAATKRRHGHLALVEGIAMKPFAGRTAR